MKGKTVNYSKNKRTKEAMIERINSMNKPKERLYSRDEVKGYISGFFSWYWDQKKEGRFERETPDDSSLIEEWTNNNLK